MSSPSTAVVAGRHGRLRVAAAVAILVVALAAAAIVFLQSGSSAPNTTSTAVPAGDTTTAVTRRTLSESSTVDGTLGYGTALELYDRLAGTFTWLPAVGSVVGRGGTLYRVNNLPVVLMYGSIPAYRALKGGVSDGPDVAQLNENLIDMGFDPYRAIADDDRFSEATAAAVRRWQKVESLTETGQVELGRITFAPSARRVTALHVALGQDPPGASGANEPASKEPASKEPASKEPASKEPASKEPASKEPASKEPASKEPASKQPASKPPVSKHKVPANKAPTNKAPKHKGSNHEASKGEPSKQKAPAEAAPKEKAPERSPAKGEGETGAGAGMLVLGTTSTQQVVQLKVKAEQQQLAHIGESAPVTLPGGDVVRGRIIEVGTVASESKEAEKGAGGGGGNPGGEGGESATISVKLALEHPVARLDQAPVSVELVKGIRKDVLTVPATALTATAGGGYAIEALEGNHRVALAVTPGMFANGYVQVEGAGVREGLTAIESR
jgi:peptidoglycan hydrolase-like protein with peptidoglycan-binding domain